MKKEINIKAIVFDVNETLLDMSPLKTSVGKALGGRTELLPLWFSTLLHYSLVGTLTDDYHSFGEIGAAALMMVAEKQGIDINKEEAREAVIPALRSMPAHPDVVSGIKAMLEDGVRVISLSNSSAEGTKTQLENAGLIDLFEKRYTIESLKKFKPHPDTYQMVLKELNVKPEEVLMVAAHPWDLAGAKKAGMQTAFIKRPGTTWYSNIDAPDYAAQDLCELVDVLKRGSCK